MRYEWLDEQVDEIIRLYVDEDQSMQSIADEFDVSSGTIRKRLLENDVSTRPEGSRYVWLDDHTEDIVERYTEKGESLQTIATNYGTSADAIKRRLLESNVELRDPPSEPDDLGFTPSQVSIVVGELLGDGCLYQMESGSCVFQVTNNKREHVAHVKRRLPDGLISSGQPYSVTRSNAFTDGDYTQWVIRSRVQPLFRELYDSWYESYEDRHRKVVPENYKLDETALLHWYWGDGNCILRDSGAPRVSFATHGFPEDSVKTLQSELESLGYANYTVKQKGVTNGSGLGIRLRDGSSRHFIGQFGPRNVVSEYDYKFPTVER
ncbi:LysM peptidoglycan-binding domain-containing protein [Haloferax volcanii]|uniref:Endonuclease I n=1 Tax=Haloferax volcanii TaxID=2246 RepID=A0A558G9L8_HALVO|nr:LysM peptidoglycan-binding domain-containing protein [Haloferax volcanii]TVT94426.1 endonuclease I [Haloferax volcanii]